MKCKSIADKSSTCININILYGMNIVLVDSSTTNEIAKVVYEEFRRKKPKNQEISDGLVVQ